MLFVAVENNRHDGFDVTLRFFTATGELPACGHGTVAALAFVAERAGGTECRATIGTLGRTFAGWVTRVNGRFDAALTQDVSRCASPQPVNTMPSSRPWASPRTSFFQARASPHWAGRDYSSPCPHDRFSPPWLRDTCDHLGLLGCYVYCLPTPEGRTAARMFAPSIGVPEDIANANSTGCLAAYLAREGMAEITVDMGDAPGNPSTITAAAWQNQGGPHVHDGGSAAIAGIVHL
jgi:trans-2,3-dihydro-3-hydroxyanthranilate isomerase